MTPDTKLPGGDASVELPNIFLLGMAFGASVPLLFLAML
jgi:hypothetical protein